jgi:hypothetical protein
VRLRHPDVAALFFSFRHFRVIFCPFDHFGCGFSALSIISAADFLPFRSFQEKRSIRRIAWSAGCQPASCLDRRFDRASSALLFGAGWQPNTDHLRDLN